MSTYTQFLYQFVFGSKNHLPFLSDKNQDILFAYIAGILKKKSCHSYIVGGAVNHIHIITHLHPTVCPAYIIKDIKEATHALNSFLQRLRCCANPLTIFHGCDHGHWDWMPQASSFNASGVVRTSTTSSMEIGI